MRLFDTLSGKKRAFFPLKGRTARIYTCGPSVYAYSHIGNFRTYLFEDILVRYLHYKGYETLRVMNLTDVEDKAVAAARRQGKSLAHAQENEIRVFFSEWGALSLLRPDVIAKASAHVPQMVSLIRRICRKGYCLDERDGTYFNVRKSRGYGMLRRLRNPRYFGFAREDDYVKEGLWDFRLWKKWTPSDGAIKWESPLGPGRPGWHIECSAIAMHYLGNEFDIHCGGADNIYPHHENEIAQSRAATGKIPASFWMHCRHLTIGKRKMSKRLGNVFYVSELMEEGVLPSDLRYFLLSERYRMRLDFTLSRLKSASLMLAGARKTIKALSKFARSAKAAPSRKLLSGFESAMDDDLNTKLAFKRLFRALSLVQDKMDSGKLKKEEAASILSAIHLIDSVLKIL